MHTQKAALLGSAVVVDMLCTVSLLYSVVLLRNNVGVFDLITFCFVWFVYTLAKVLP